MASLLQNTLMLLLVSGMVSLACLTPAAAEEGKCQPNAIAYRAEDGFSGTTERRLVNVPATKVKFVQGGTKPSCVIISFSAEAHADAGDIMHLLAIRDPQPDGFPTRCNPRNQLEFATPNEFGFTAFSTHAMNFVCADVPPGEHVVLMLYGTTFGKGVQMRARTMIVHYLK